MKKLIMTLALCAGAMNASTLVLSGVVSQIDGPNSKGVNIGDPVVYRQSFSIWEPGTKNNLGLEPWNGQKSVFTWWGDGDATYLRQQDGDMVAGVAYGAEITSAFRSGPISPDHFTVEIDELKRVSGLWVSGTFESFYWNEDSGSFATSDRSDYSDTFVYGTITDATFTSEAETPEPSTLLLSTPVLLGLWSYRRIRTPRGARPNLNRA